MARFSARRDVVVGSERPRRAEERQPLRPVLGKLVQYLHGESHQFQHLGWGMISHVDASKVVVTGYMNPSREFGWDELHLLRPIRPRSHKGLTLPHWVKMGARLTWHREWFTGGGGRNVRIETQQVVVVAMHSGFIVVMGDEGQLTFFDYPCFMENHITEKNPSRFDRQEVA